MGAKDQGADATAGRWLTIPRTLCFVTHGGDILLLRRGQHKRIYPGRYNGVGGHIERDEDALTSAIRETQEETGLDVVNVCLRGVIHVDAGSETGIMVFVFTAEATSRQFVDSDEGTLEWVARDQLESLPLVEDLPALISRIFDGDPTAPPFFAHSSYDARDEQILLFANQH
ncbi:MAG: NUDIX domain-containing protein [Chloroflexi bacterium]|nr:MAG: NUDIX domain-containing protein [Chloroflexota bacterium]